jgi:ribosomal protein S18 acetylase RimI-like enzyme
MRIRPAAPADDEALVALDRAVWSPELSVGPEPAPDTRFFARTDPGDVVVAEEDGTVIGYVQVEPATPLASNAHVLEIHGLAVAPDRQRRGIARVLLEAALEHARGRGARRLRLRVLGTNAAARATYRASGFVEEGILREEFLLEGRYVDDVLMVRDIASPV